MVPIQGEQRSPETVFEMPQSDSQSSHENSRKQRRGIAWVAGSFLFCPCHLPFTLGLLVALLSGTALGTFVLHYSLLVGAIITLVWAAGTWYGFHQTPCPHNMHHSIEDILNISDNPYAQGSRHPSRERG